MSAYKPEANDNSPLIALAGNDPVLPTRGHSPLQDVYSALFLAGIMALTYPRPIIPYIPD